MVGATASQLVEIDGRRLRLSNLDKVLYPATGTTKGELIDYYRQIAHAMLPHLRDRPVTRARWPDGTGAASFFAKALEPGAPSWLRRLPISHSDGVKEYPLVDDLAGLVLFAQTASLELHTPQWRFDERGVPARPDRLVLDLDPGPDTGLAECAAVARWAREILLGVGMDPHPVTSGSKGIHLYTRVDGARTADELSAFAKELARALEADHPDLVTSQMAKAARTGKVFLDWSQNNGKKTTIAPYSLRGVAAPTVAAPRTWDELDAPDLAHLDIGAVAARVATTGDLLAPLAPTPPAPLDAYLAKRRRGRTPEPMPAHPAPPARPGTAAPRFVVQDHHASGHHFDLRLERDGVLVSWAVPRGIPSPGEPDRLAVMTEPHPLEYLAFEGEIPATEYGGGRMTIWDTGTAVIEKWRDDEVIATLSGRADGPLGTARIALIRTDGDGPQARWLLHRMTPSARAGAHARRAAPPAAPAAEPAAPSARSAIGPPMLATGATEALATAAAARWGADAWVEFKWDGVRALAEWDGRRLRLRARSGTDITARYPELTAAELGLGDLQLHLDGEIVAVDERGAPSFARLQRRMHLTAAREIEREAVRTPVRYEVFDVLRVGADDVRHLALRERRRLLETALRDAKAPLEVPPVAVDVGDALRTAAALALEGVVVKDPSSPYRSGIRSDQWLKVKFVHTRDVVIGGVRPGRGARAGGIGSLLVAVPDDDGLRYVGRVGSGFGDDELERLERMLAPLRRDHPSLHGVPAADAADAWWVEPQLVGEVAFAEFSPAGSLRHARWRGLRPDISPDDVPAA